MPRAGRAVSVRAVRSRTVRACRGTGVLGALATLALCGVEPTPAAAADGAMFSVGAAVRSVVPEEPVSPAGSNVGQVDGTTNVHDPLETRAMYVANGERAVVFVATDIFGQFAAVREGAELGLQAVREAAARRITELGGPPVRVQDVVVSSSHSHATGSVQGYWGRPPVRFMRMLAERQVEAAVAAARAARPARLEWGEADGARLNALTVAQVNAYEGWVPDGQVSVLRAVDATSRATIATYATIPVHPVLMPGVAYDPPLLSSDYTGAVRDRLDRVLGGVSLVAPGTLGRQTTPWSLAGKDLAAAERQVAWFSTEAASIVLSGLERARPVTDGRLESAESLEATPIVNGVVLAITGAQHVPGDLWGPLSAGTVMWPLNRSGAEPWQSGVVLRTPLTAVRLGGLLFVSQPGEPFAEIRLALRDLIRDADQVVAISQAQDALGYYYPLATAALLPAYAPNDHALFNVSPHFGDQVVQADVRLARELGFRTLQPAALQPPLGNAYERALSSGIQALASPHQGSACGGTLTSGLQAVYSPVLHQAHVGGGPEPRGGKVRWRFGDGEAAATGFLHKPARGVRAAPRGGEAIVRHAYPPGRYTATVGAVDELGGRPSWSMPVRVFDELRADVRARRSASGTRLTAVGRGGSGRLVRVTWTGPGGRSGDGAVLRLPRGARGTVVLEVADTSGAIATTRLRLGARELRTGARTCSSQPGERVAVAGRARVRLPPETPRRRVG